jgi:hypothetical protein
MEFYSESLYINAMTIISPSWNRFSRQLPMRLDKGLFHSAADLQSDAMRFCSEVQSTARAVAGGLQSVNRGRSSRQNKLNEGNYSMLSAHG